MSCNFVRKGPVFELSAFNQLKLYYHTKEINIEGIFTRINRCSGKKLIIFDNVENAFYLFLKNIWV